MRPHLILIFLLFMQSCIFSGSDYVETDIVKGFKIYSIAGSRNLILKHSDEETHTIVISENIDSIAWDEAFIYGYATKKYFIVNQTDNNVRWFSDYSELIKNINPLHSPKLKSVESL